MYDDGNIFLDRMAENNSLLRNAHLRCLLNIIAAFADKPIKDLFRLPETLIYQRIAPYVGCESSI